MSMPAATGMPPRFSPYVSPPTPQNKSTAEIFMASHSLSNRILSEFWGSGIGHHWFSRTPEAGRFRPPLFRFGGRHNPISRPPHKRPSGVIGISVKNPGIQRPNGPHIRAKANRIVTNVTCCAAIAICCLESKWGRTWFSAWKILAAFRLQPFSSIDFQFKRYPVPQRFEISGLALPNDHNAPAHAIQLPLLLPVSLGVPFELQCPKGTMRCGSHCLTTMWVMMPKTAVDEDYLPPTGQDDIGMPWEVGAMKTKAVSQRVKQPPDGNFWLCVACPNPAHQFTSFSRR